MCIGSDSNIDVEWNERWRHAVKDQLSGLSAIFMQTHQHTRSLISQNPYRSYVILSIWKTNSTRIKSINQKEQRSLITFPTVPSAAERPRDACANIWTDNAIKHYKRQRRRHRFHGWHTHTKTCNRYQQMFLEKTKQLFLFGAAAFLHWCKQLAYVFAPFSLSQAN